MAGNRNKGLTESNASRAQREVAAKQIQHKATQAHEAALERRIEKLEETIRNQVAILDYCAAQIKILIR